MKKSMKYAICSGVTILGILLMIIGFAMTGFNYTKFINDQEEIRNRVIEKTGIESLVIDVVDEDIEVVVSSDDQIHIQYTEGKNRKYVFEKQDGMISLSRKRRSFYIQLNPFEALRKSPKIVVEIPESALDKLKIENVAGKISVDGNFASIVDVANAAGKIELTDLVSKRVVAETTAGKIQLRGCRIERGDFDVVAGQISGTLIGYKNDYSISTSTVAGTSNLKNQITSDTSKILNFNVVAGDISIIFREEDTN